MVIDKSRANFNVTQFYLPVYILNSSLSGLSFPFFGLSSLLRETINYSFFFFNNWNILHYPFILRLGLWTEQVLFVSAQIYTRYKG